MKRKSIILMLLLINAVFLCLSIAYAGVYLNSAHGNSSYGVNRSAAGYSKGHCDHCHEQHASVDGSEPSPTGGPDQYSLFNDNYVSQTSGICYDCHNGSGTLNRSYSYRSGGWTSDTVDDILESFSFSSPDSSHNLDNIRTFITGKWGYTANSNPCNACHNPHAVQGDPANLPNSAKTSTRGYPVSRPSLHSTDNNSWGLWGDGAGEKMSDYTTGYWAPYRYYATVPSSSYEPDGSTTQNGTNMTDFVTFCTDCHNNTNTIYSTALGRNLHKFNWSIEKHGGGAASDACPEIFMPYLSVTCGTYVLSCTDCHEPHGSPNLYLIRKVVNGGVVTVDTGTGTGPDGPGYDNKEWLSLCINCHDELLADSNHTHPNFIPPEVAGCSLQCHNGFDEYRDCTECHFHGNNIVDGTAYGEQLF